ncbi:MAG: YebC/PmpR family DNA-binding transcriptional regulator [Thermodesulfobacteriota bacterium]
MSGHSKWANIKHKKSREDAKRGKVFTKLIREITVATKMGGEDPAANPRLRAAIDKAKAENLPGDTMKRAIKRGSADPEGVNYDEITYEGYGPGGVAVLVEVMTDNRNRTASEVRQVFNKNGGGLGESGCVAWNFEKKGLFTFEAGEVDEDLLMETAIEAGADDVVEVKEDDIFEVYTTPSNFHNVKEAFENKGIKWNLSEISMIPKTTVKIKGKEIQQMLRLMDSMEDCDDVQNVYANFDIPTDDMEELGK